MRVAMHLRALLGELGMLPISSILPFPKIASSLDEKGNTRNEHIEPSTRRFLDEFIWYLEALKNQRAKGTPF
jgi:NAD(P)H-dependent FMN reductase